MSNFFRKIPQLLVVLVLVSVVYIGPVHAAESDTSASPPIVTLPAPAGGAPVSIPDTSGSADTSDSSPDTLPGDTDVSDGGSGGFSFGGYDTFTVSGADVTVNVEKHDTLSVPSVALGTPEVSDHYSSPHAEPDTLTLAETIRALFGPYTPRTQTVTTYYDGQAISTDEQIVPGLAGLDYEWIAGVVLFALTFYCLFRILGGVIKNG